jgi:hypothetical protein
MYFHLYIKLLFNYLKRYVNTILQRQISNMSGGSANELQVKLINKIRHYCICIIDNMIENILLSNNKSNIKLTDNCRKEFVKNFETKTRKISKRTFFPGQNGNFTRELQVVKQHDNATFGINFGMMVLYDKFDKIFYS